MTMWLWQPLAVRSSEMIKRVDAGEEPYCLVAPRPRRTACLSKHSDFARIEWDIPLPNPMISADGVDHQDSYQYAHAKVRAHA